MANFGFQDSPCDHLPIAAKHNSVSVFKSDGTAITHADGYTQGNLSWPMSVVPDRQGNIWITNCGNDTVTKYPGGDPNRAFNIALGPAPPANDPQIKPFGAVIDAKGNLWVNGNRSHTVYVISPDGTVIDTLPGTDQGKTLLSHPIGNAVDSKGNIWVSNSDWLDTPCPTRTMLGTATNPSVTMFDAKDRKPHPGSPFTGGGITLPWGIAVDGDDTVWVFNFGAAKSAPKPPLRPESADSVVSIPRNVRPACRSAIRYRRTRAIGATLSSESRAVRSIRRETFGSPTTGKSTAMGL